MDTSPRRKHKEVDNNQANSDTKRIKSSSVASDRGYNTLSMCERLTTLPIEIVSKIFLYNLARNKIRNLSLLLTLPLKNRVVSNFLRELEISLFMFNVEAFKESRLKSLLESIDNQYFLTTVDILDIYNELKNVKFECKPPDYEINVVINLLIFIKMYTFYEDQSIYEKFIAIREGDNDDMLYNTCQSYFSLKGIFDFTGIHLFYMRNNQAHLWILRSEIMEIFIKTISHLTIDYVELLVSENLITTHSDRLIIL